VQKFEKCYILAQYSRNKGPLAREMLGSVHSIKIHSSRKSCECKKCFELAEIGQNCDIFCANNEIAGSVIR
jgi:hypothetical protein